MRDYSPAELEALDALSKGYQRLNRGCRLLHARGLVERKRGGSFGGNGYSYRLLPPLRAAKPCHPRPPTSTP